LGVKVLIFIISLRRKYLCDDSIRVKDIHSKV